MIVTSRAVRTILLIAFLFSSVAISSIVFSSCSGDNSTGSENEPPEVATPIGPDGGQVVSADGLLTLTFPGGALTGTETITITSKDQDELGSEFDGVLINLVLEKRTNWVRTTSPLRNPLRLPFSLIKW